MEQLSGNGSNKFFISVKCPHYVGRGEWLELLLAINALLQTHEAGRYSNVGAYLEDAR